jgi:hypothetical protein
MHDPVGHRMRHPFRTEHAQTTHADRASRGAIAIEVADYDDMPVFADGLRE